MYKKTLETIVSKLFPFLGTQHGLPLVGPIRKTSNALALPVPLTTVDLSTCVYAITVKSVPIIAVLTYLIQFIYSIFHKLY